MKVGSLLPTHVLRPVLDQYRDSPIALVGCNSFGIERPSCELDVLVIINERNRAVSIRSGRTFIDLFFATEREVLDPRNPEVSMALSKLRAVRDAGLVLSASSAAAAAVFESNARKSSQRRLSSAVKALGRADEALGRRSALDADFWLLSAAYEFGYALLYSGLSVPAPSHILQQLRNRPKGVGRDFEAFSKGAGLENASRVSSSARLEGIAVLHDAIRSGSGRAQSSGSQWSAVQSALVKRKADYLADAVDHAEAYSFLGLEAVKVVRALEAKGGRTAAPSGKEMIVTQLLEGKERTLGERVVRDLGLVRETGSVEAGLRALKERVSALARTL